MNYYSVEKSKNLVLNIFVCYTSKRELLSGSEKDWFGTHDSKWDILHVSHIIIWNHGNEWEGLGQECWVNRIENRIINI